MPRPILAPPRPRSWLRRGLALALVGLALGCTRSDSAGGEPVVVDGVLGEWSDASVRADGYDVAVRLDLPEEITLQAAPYSVSLLIDADGSAETGSGLPYVDGDTDVGAEIAIVFSPPGGRPPLGGQGVAALRLPERGAKSAMRPLAHADLDLVFAPTYASDRFEVRFARHVDGHPDLSAALADGDVAVTAVAASKSSELLWIRRLGRVELPPPASSERRVRALVPERSDGAIRIVSWNVLLSSPMRDAEPFARVLRGLEPDIVLAQEWETTDAAELERWFAEHVGGPWHALDAAGWGVAIVARWPLARLGADAVDGPGEPPADSPPKDRALRLAAAIVDSPFGPIAAASVHLKCCGGAGSEEEEARRAEARLARDALARALAEREGEVVQLRVVGGDLNLVGTRRPLDVLRTGLGAQGADLAVAPAEVCGDRAVYTWRAKKGPRFSPGRLDFLLYGGGGLVRGFAVDTARLDEEALAALGVDGADSAASDHLALVLDLRPSASPVNAAE